MGLAGTGGKAAGAAGGVMAKKLVMAGLVVAVLGVGGVLGWKYFSGGGVVGATGLAAAVANEPAPVVESKPVAWTKETALAQLSKEYALAEGEVIRKVPAPIFGGAGGVCRDGISQFRAAGHCKEPGLYVGCEGRNDEFVHVLRRAAIG